MPPTRASSRSSWILRAASRPRSSSRAVRAVFDQFPNQLVEIYSVLAERIGETLSGEVAPFFVSVFGPDLDARRRGGGRDRDAAASAGRRAAPCASRCRRVSPSCRCSCGPEQLSLYGLQAADVLGALNAAYHGTEVAQLNQSDRSVPVVVRIAGCRRDARRMCGALRVRGRDGVLVPLAAVATLTMVSARSLVEHEDGLRRQVVIASPTTADQAGFARAAQQAIAAHVKLPPNVYLRYGGTAPAQAAAARELLWHSAAALVLIVLLLALAFGHSRHVLLVLAALPSTLIGGVAAVALTRRHALARGHGRLRGAVRHGRAQHHPADLALRASGQRRRRSRGDWRRRCAAPRSGSRRCCSPLCSPRSRCCRWRCSRAPGHEIEGPMAVVILGGLVSSTFVSLVLVPPLAARWLRR